MKSSFSDQLAKTKQEQHEKYLRARFENLQHKLIQLLPKLEALAAQVDEIRPPLIKKAENFPKEEPEDFKLYNDLIEQLKMIDQVFQNYLQTLYEGNIPKHLHLKKDFDAVQIAVDEYSNELGNNNYVVRFKAYCQIHARLDKIQNQIKSITKEFRKNFQDELDEIKQNIPSLVKKEEVRINITEDKKDTELYKPSKDEIVVISINDEITTPSFFSKSNKKTGEKQPLLDKQSKTYLTQSLALLENITNQHLGKTIKEVRVSNFKIGDIELPRDMVNYILGFLDQKDLAMLARTCKYLKQMTEQKALWASLAKRKFPHLEENIKNELKKDNVNMKKLFRNQLMSNKKYIYKEGKKIKGFLQEKDNTCRWCIGIWVTILLAGATSVGLFATAANSNNVSNNEFNKLLYTGVAFIGICVLTCIIGICKGLGSLVIEGAGLNRKAREKMRIANKELQEEYGETFETKNWLINRKQ